MSYGLVICSKCNREVHQDGDRRVRNGWRHCGGATPMCEGANAVYPASRDEIVGEYCGKDDFQPLKGELKARLRASEKAPLRPRPSPYTFTAAMKRVRVRPPCKQRKRRSR